MTQLTEDERRLLSLFRCMKTEEQDELLQLAYRRLLSRLPVAQRFVRPEDLPASIAEEMESELDERLVWLFPSDDTDAYDIHLFVGDFLSLIIKSAFPDLVETLLSTEGRDQVAATELIEAIDLEYAEGFLGVEERWFNEENAARAIKSWRNRIVDRLIDAATKSKEGSGV